MEPEISSNGQETLDVVIVGAGAAGVGCGVVLKQLGIERFALLERHEVGASFTRWPKEMRFITPSFTSNGFGLLDLNAVVLGSSPALGARREHFDGPEYALYLDAMAKHFALPVWTGVEVYTVQPIPGQESFRISTSNGSLSSRFVIWAAGEFQYPRLNPFSGAALCLHSAQIRSWHDVAGDNILIIGGAESGIDAAVSLCALGKRVRVLDKATSWNSESSDPSRTLSPYTFERLETAQQTGRLELTGDVLVKRVELTEGQYIVQSETGEYWTTPFAPILATGFTGSLSMIAELFAWHEEGYALLTPQDESTRTPGLFVVGPQVRHENIIFCFIYKFRQRFAVVAHAIAERLGRDTTPLQVYRQKGMFLDDLSCCTEPCVC
jgi:putative flavoprotein involved in K+ transport